MKEFNENIDFNLIGKYLAGETSREEKEYVDNWIASSEDNRNDFIRLQNLWKSAASPQEIRPADVDTVEAWQKLKARIEAGNRGLNVSHRGNERSTYYYPLRAAAAIFIGIIVYFLITHPFTGGINHEMITTGKILNKILPDSSRVTVNVNSRISYPGKFNYGKREVELNGEAFFEVKHIASRPFVVRMKDAVVQVLGTEFDIRDIESEPDVTVTVKEGRVKFMDKDEISYVYLESGEKGILHKNTGIIEKIRHPDENDLYWKTRTLLFRSTKLNVVFKTLEKIFRIHIQVENGNILNCTLSGRFQDATAEEVLDKIALSFDFKIEKQDIFFKVTGDGCEVR